MWFLKLDGWKYWPVVDITRTRGPLSGIGRSISGDSLRWAARIGCYELCGQSKPDDERGRDEKRKEA